MNQIEFDKVVRDTISSIEKLLIVKGGEYAGSEDRLANFKRGAVQTGVHPLQVLFIYLSKHYDAFATYVRDTANGTTRPRSESIEGRLDDLINYCLLAKGLIADTNPIGPRPVEEWADKISKHGGDVNQSRDRIPGFHRPDDRLGQPVRKELLRE